MLLRALVAATALVLASQGTAAPTPFTALHPEEAHPDPDTRAQSGPYADLVSRVQERLRALGFDAGPVNGDFGEKTQAALAQFQLSRAIPASGQLDDPTLAELGVTRDDAASSAGAGS